MHDSILCVQGYVLYSVSDNISRECLNNPVRTSMITWVKDYHVSRFFSAIIMILLYLAIIMILLYLGHG